MSRAPKPLTVARLNDLILGSFANVKPSETLDHLVRYLGTWSGSELRTSFLDQCTLAEISNKANFSW
jgi:hypothetical protein